MAVKFYFGEIMLAFSDFNRIVGDFLGNLPSHLNYDVSKNIRHYVER